MADKTTYIKILLIVIVLYLLYFFASIYNFQLLCNIISPLCAMAAAGILAYCYKKYDKKNPARKVLLMYALACGAWVIGDIFWAVSIFRGENPSGSDLVNYAYLATNVFLFAGSLMFMIHRYKRWSMLQLFLDITAICFLTLMTVWIVFFEKSDRWIEYLTKDGFASAASIVLDVFIFIGCFIWFLSRGCGEKKPPFRIVIVFSLLGFALNDINYYILYTNNVYRFNSITDTLYVAALLLAAMATFWNATRMKNSVPVEKSPDEGSGIRWFYLLIFPAVTFTARNLNFSDILTDIMIIVIYAAASKQVQLNKKTGELLSKEKEINTILESRVESQLQALTALANQDTVTNLFNRRYFINTLEKSMKNTGPGGTLTLLLMDIDRFKNINDNFGHNVGDMVLSEIAERLMACNTENGTIARLGGDEFAILFHENRTRYEMDQCCRRIIEVLSAPIRVDDKTLHITVSIGIANYPKDATDSVVLLKNADISMYSAKSQGYNNFVYYNSFFKDTLNKKREIELLLRQAVMDRDFELYYQPQFSIPDKKLIGAEALLRWKSPDHGYIPPGDFIPVAEEIDYIVKIGKWVIKEAIRKISLWNKSNGIQLRIGINISPKQLSRESFMDILSNSIQANLTEPSWLDLEITENIMLSGHEKVNSIFGILRNMGISISIDDFGSGYSSWGYLTKFPFDRIKIDRALIDNLSYKNPSSIQIVKAIISMCKATGKLTIAEGVETREQLEILREIHCDQFQGYLMGEPVPAPVFEERFIKPCLEAAGLPQKTACE